MNASNAFLNEGVIPHLEPLEQRVLLSAGDLDPTFGVGGLVTTDFGSSEAALSVAVQTDGKIVVAGSSDQGATGTDFALARYNSDGTLDDGGPQDTTLGDYFGTNGFVTTDFGGSHDYGRSIAVQADGKIVVAGSSDQGATGTDFALARYNSDGSLDENFGTNGKVTTDFGSSSGNISSEQVYSVTIDADDKIVVAGVRFHGWDTGRDFVLARYNSDGTLDDTFGQDMDSDGTKDGLVVTDFAGGADYACSVAIQADHKIVVAGRSNQSGTGSDFALVRYNTDGSLDDGTDSDLTDGDSFGTGGKVTTNFGQRSAPREDRAYSVAIQADGKIVVVGSSYYYVGGDWAYDFALARYNSDGSPDATFGQDMDNDGTQDGLVLTDLAGEDDYAYSVAMDGDDKIVVAGKSHQGTATRDDFALARYNSDGSLDETFGQDINGDGTPDGVVMTDFAGSSDYAWSVAIDGDGKIVAAGYTSPVGPLDIFEAPSTDFALARYNPNGSPDLDFDGDGKVTTKFGAHPDRAHSIAIQDDGKIVAAGSSDGDSALARYNTDGSLDTTFSGDGKVTSDLNGSRYDDVVFGLAIQRDDKIVAVGGSGDDFAVTRYNIDGTLDWDFGMLGTVTTDFGAWSGDGARSVAIDGDGKIVVAGYSDQGGVAGYDFALARYTSHGSLDWKVTTDFGGLDDVARSVAVQADGKIVAAGYSTQGATGYDFALARYNSDGSLDETFGQDMDSDGTKDGLVLTDFGALDDYAYSVAIDDDGKMVVVGRSNQGATGVDFALARYDSDGSLDTTFGQDMDSDGTRDGLVLTDFVGSDDHGHSVAVQTNGRIVAAGMAGGDFALARYDSDGDLDTTFGGNGKVTTDFAGQSDRADSIAVEWDGNIVVAGRSYQGATGYDFALARYMGDPGNLPPVADPGGPYAPDEGESFQLDASGTSDPEERNTALTYEWDLDYDGITFVVDATAADMQPTVSFAEDLPARTIAVRVTDSGGLTDIATTSLEVGNVAPTVDAGSDQTADKGETVSVFARFSDPGTADTHTAEINWGDGTVEPALVNQPAGIVSGSHAYADYAIYTVTVTVTDNDGAATFDTLEVTVENVPAPGSDAELLLDINTDPGASTPAEFLEVNGTLFFEADDGTSGKELWKTDGTAAGTVLVKDINPGAGDSDPHHLTNVNGMLFFRAGDGTNGRELWKSDGTAAGTVMVEDIFPGSGASDPVFLTNVNGTLFFSADDGTNGLELWKSDGSALGTVLVEDILPGSVGSNLSDLTNFNGTLFFRADDGTNGTERWMRDGAATGTVMVKDINPGGDSFPSYLANLNGTLFFRADDGTSGKELWKSDGTAEGTVIVKDIRPGGDNSLPQYLTSVSGTLFFMANDGSSGWELWMSDGTRDGTVMVKDINPGGGSSYPDTLTNVNGTLYFRADDGSSGWELWKSDGTEEGTVIVKDILAGAGSGNPQYLTNVNGMLFFSADDGTNGRELWMSDGTEAGTVMVANINPGAGRSLPQHLTSVNGTLFFSADDGTHGFEPWILQTNHAPVADAGEDVSIFFGESAYLYGSATDTNDDPVLNPTWSWTIDVKPAESLALLYPPTIQNPVFIPDLTGDYVLSLVVSDGTYESLPDSITVHVALNLPPVAVATADVTTGPAPLTVNFDASQSYDPEGAPVTILWAFDDGSYSSEIAPSHVFERVDTYLVRVYVKDDWEQPAQDSLLIEVTANHPPVADAGEDVSIFLGENAFLYGTGTDPDGDPIVSWSWTIDVKPEGSTPYLSDATRQDPIFIPDLAGDYVLSLVVGDGTYDSLPDSMTVHAALNLPPVAIATADVTTGTAPLTVNFDGSQSFDPDGDPLTTLWMFDDGSDSTEIAPTHTFQWAGTYLVRLQVRDDWAQAAQDTLLIEVLPAANPPVADAGEDVSIFFGESVFLQGSATDPDGDPIVSWSWTIDVKPEGSRPHLSDAASQDPVFLPDLTGDYVLSLVVSDGTNDSLPDSMTVHVALNLPPVAIATADVTTGTAPLTVNFDASQSFDPEGSPITYTWLFGDGTHSSEIAPTHVFQWATTYLVKLKVVDHWGQITDDTLLIEVLPAANNPPVADAGEDVDMFFGESAALHGTATDPDGDPIVSWSWTIDAKPEGSTPILTDPTDQYPFFIPNMAGDYVLSLVVSDGTNESLPDSITVHAALNLPPVAIATADVTTGTAPLTVNFDASQSFDPEGAPVTILWAFGDGSYSSEIAPTHVFERIDTYLVRMYVEDDWNQYAQDTLLIEVLPAANNPPVADAGEDVSIFFGESVVLHGTATDSDGDPIVSWLWTIDVKPEGSVASLSYPTTQDPVFWPDLTGDYVLSLVVSDGTNESLPDSITVHVTLNLPPVAIATADVTTGTAPLTVNFDSSQSYDPEGSPVTTLWLFGDGSHSYEIAPTHVFEWTGTYLVRVYVEDDRDQLGKAAQLIKVLPAANKHLV